MSKTAKKVLIIALAALLIVGAVFGALTLLRNFNREPVKVFSIEQIGMTDYYGDPSETDGSVEEFGIQKVMLSENQTVREIYVKEGQKIAEGDPILKYDTTLTDIDVRRAELKVSELELDLKNAQKELQRISALKPHKTTHVVPDNNVVYEPSETPLFLQGSGTYDDPYCFLWSYDNTLDAATIADLAADVTTAEEGEEAEEAEVYVVLIERENDALNAPITRTWGLILVPGDAGVSLRFCEPNVPEELQKYDEIPEPYDVESGSDYSAAELAAMRKEKAEEISALTLSVKMADVDYKRIKAEAGDGTVYSKITGTVTAVRDPARDYDVDEPVVEISAGGGYYVIGTISELALDSVKPGQTVSITAYTESDDTINYDCTVKEIGDTPVDDQSYYYYDGIPNSSYYPFKVFVSADNPLQNAYYVTISYENAEQSESDSIYLNNAFIRTENGKSYVFVRGEDQRLEKRVVTPGVDLWGEMTEIKKGLTADDLVAFPYGSDVFEGARTKVADDEDIEAMYNY